MPHLQKCMPQKLKGYLLRRYGCRRKTKPKPILNLECQTIKAAGDEFSLGLSKGLDARGNYNQDLGKMILLEFGAHTNARTS